MPRDPLPIGGHGNITITKTSAGTFQADTYYRDDDGVTRRVRARGGTKARAGNALQDKLTKRQTPGQSTLTGGSTIAVAAQAWLDLIEKTERRSATMRNYRQSVKVHIRPLIGDWKVRELHAGKVDSFLKGVAKGRTETVGPEGKKLQLGGATAARHCKVALTQIMDMCIRHGAIRENPVKAVRLDRTARKAVTALTVEDVSSIRKQVIEWGEVKASGPARNAPLLVDFLDVLAGTGCRPNEVLALRWEDVDLQVGTASISGTVTRTEEGLIRQGMPKTDTSNREVTLPRFVVLVLKKRKLAAPHQSGGVFTTKTGSWYELSNLHRVWRKARGDTWKHVSFDAYRKAVATIIKRALGDEAAAAQLGHSSPEITRRYYIERTQRVDFSEIVDGFGA